MSIQCKAYLLQDGAKEPSEIRSFRLDEGAASNYDYLRNKLATIFPNLGWDEDGSALKLLWKDRAGDFVTFSSDEELVDALGEVAEDGIFRVYICHTTKKGGEFPWQSYVNDLWKSLNNETQYERPTGPGCSASHPYARRGGCGARRGYGSRGGCGPQRRRFPSGFFVDPYPGFFPGFHAEMWAFDGDETDTQGPGCCGQWQKQSQTQPSPGEKRSQDAEKPPTSSS